MRSPGTMQPTASSRIKLDEPHQPIASDDLYSIKHQESKSNANL
jgi:hypothetical protein